MAFLGMDPQFKAYNQSPLHEAVGGEVVLPIKVMSPDSILIKNGATLHNPTDWSIESGTNRVTLKYPAKAGDQFSVMNLASFSVADMVSKSAKDQQIMASPRVVDVPTDPKQLATVSQVSSSDSSKNMVINPNFWINQRSNIGLNSHLTMTAAGPFSDCWKHATAIAAGGPSGTFTHQRITGDVAVQDYIAGKIPVPAYGIVKHVLSSYSPTVRTTTAVAQRLEEYYWAAGEDVTFSFYARCPTAATDIGIAVGNLAVDTSDINVKYPLIRRVRIGTDWQRYEFTFKMPTLSDKTLVSTGKMLSIEFCLNAINDNTNGLYGTITNANEIHITGVMLEKGTVATPFNPRSHQDEQNRCYRYIYCLKYVGVPSLSNSSTVTDRYVSLAFPQGMLSPPTCLGELITSQGAVAPAKFMYITNIGLDITTYGSGLSYQAGHYVYGRDLTFSAEL